MTVKKMSLSAFIARKREMRKKKPKRAAQRRTVRKAAK